MTDALSTDIKLSNDAKAVLEAVQMLAGTDTDAELWIPDAFPRQELVDAGLIVSVDTVASRHLYFLTEAGRNA